MLLVPSGFPLLLSLYWKFVHPHIIILKLFLAALMICSAWFCYLLMKKFLPPLESYGIALAFSSAWWFVYMSNSVLSETVFIPLLYAACLLAMKSEEPSVHRTYGWIALLCWVLLARTRGLGMPLLFGYTVWLAIRKDWKKLFTGAGITAICAIAERSLVVKEFAAPGYLHAFNEEYPLFSSRFFPAVSHLSAITFHNFWSFAGSMYTNFLFPYFYNLVTMNPIKRIFVVALFINGCFGAWILWKQKPAVRPIITAALFYWTTVFFWCDDITYAMFRYTFPFFPFLLLTAFFPVFQALRRIKFPWRNAICAGILVVVIANQIWRSFSQSFEDPFVPDRNDFKALHSFISSVPHKPDVILSQQSYYTFLKTGVHSLNIFLNGKAICAYALTYPTKDIWLIVNNKNAPQPKLIDCGSLSFVSDTKPLRIQGIWSLYRIKEIQTSANH